MADSRKKRPRVVARCDACGEGDQETFADQWTGEDVPPWRGRTPRCGFCGHELTPLKASFNDGLFEESDQDGE